MKVKAKIAGYGTKDCEVIIFIAGLWRIFGTPFSIGRNDVKPYKTSKAAKNGAEKTAAALNIKLEWED